MDTLFGAIQCRIRDDEWGSVLDAGTGEHSLQWLFSNRDKTTRIVAVTGDEAYAEKLIAKFQSKMRPQDRIIAGNWTSQELLKGETFDIVVVDYLIGALDGFSPYYQDQIIPRLIKTLGPHGQLHIVGMEPPPSFGATKEEELILEIFQARDACILLAGHRCYREYPLKWVLRQVKNNGLEIFFSASFTIKYTPSALERQLDVARRKLTLFSDASVARSMEAYLDKLSRKAASCSQILFGADYVVSCHI